MDSAQDFLDRQIAEYEEQLRAAEARRAEFRREYAEYLPDSGTGVSRLSTLERQVVELRRDYQNALSNQVTLQAQLSQVPQFIEQDYAPTVAPDGQLVGASVYVRLAQARARLAELRQNYTDLHPNVRAALRQVETLEAQVEAEGAPDGSGQGSTRVLNPIYEQIRVRIVDMNVTVQTALNRLNDVTAERDRVRQLFQERPDIEAMSIDLDRDYEILRSNYVELLRRRESALLSEAAENEADRTQFRVVDPPFVPENPSSPDIPMLASLVLFAALGAGASLPLGYEFLRGTYASASSLREMGLPVIGTITFVSPPGRNRSLLSGITGPALCLFVLVAVYGVLIFVGVDLSMGFTWA